MLTAGQILQLIRHGSCHTRRELIAYTGLSRSTITERVDRLIEAGYIHESGVGASGGGRPPSVLDIDATSRLVLVADLGASHARVALTDLAARPMAEEHAEIRIDRGPEAVLSWIRAGVPAPARSLGPDLRRGVRHRHGPAGLGGPQHRPGRSGRS